MGILMLNGNNYTGGVQQVFGSSSGDIATFTDGGDNKPLKSLKVAINPVQEGSGDPSPSNVRPIIGWDEVDVNVSPTQDAEDGTTYIIQLGSTYYGGELDVKSGVLKVTDGYIASYNGETLPSTWMSDRDVYAPNTSPTTGAEVVYKLATPQEIQLTPTQVMSLLGNNNIWSDTGDILECVYQRDLNIVINQFDARITALEQAMASLSGTRSLSLSKSAPIEEPKEEETNEEITEEPKEEEQNEDKR